MWLFSCYGWTDLLVLVENHEPIRMGGVPLLHAQFELNTFPFPLYKILKNGADKDQILIWSNWIFIS